MEHVKTTGSQYKLDTGLNFEWPVTVLIDRLLNVFDVEFAELDFILGQVVSWSCYIGRVLLYYLWNEKTASFDNQSVCRCGGVKCLLMCGFLFLL